MGSIYDLKKSTVTIEGVEVDYDIYQNCPDRPLTGDINIAIKPPKIDESMPEHLYARKVNFCPLCGFRFLRPSANLSHPLGFFAAAKILPRLPYLLWASFYLCPCCGLYYVNIRHRDAVLDSVCVPDCQLAICRLPNSTRHCDVEASNQNLIKQFAEMI